MKKRVLMLGIAFMLAVMPTVNVLAVTKSEAQQQKNEAQKNLNAVNNSIENLEEDKEAVQEEIVEIDAQLVDLLLTVELISSDIEAKQAAIDEAQIQYDAAKAKEEEQYESMKKRIKFMYEKGDQKYIEMFLQSQSIAEMVNKSDYIELLYEYDRQMLKNYQETKEEVGAMKDSLEVEKSELVEMQEEYVAESKALQSLIDEKKKTLENFESQLSAAKAKASAYQSQIKQQTAILKQIEAEEAAARKKAAEEAKKKAEEERRRKEEEAKKKADEEKSELKDKEEPAEETEESKEEPKEEPKQEEPKEEPSGGGASSSGGSGKGKEIANFACQYVGNPYVAGGTSLTNGADCSGFTTAVFKNFGISLPRSSYAQSTYGKEVSYSEAQPGDIIYYGGHVGIYIGGGQIVHASTPSTGIKISNALYRSNITVRRVI